MKRFLVFDLRNYLDNPIRSFRYESDAFSFVYRYNPFCCIYDTERMTYFFFNYVELYPSLYCCGYSNRLLMRLSK